MGNTCIKPAVDAEADIAIDHNSCPSSCCQFESFTCCVITKAVEKPQHHHHKHKAAETK